MSFLSNLVLPNIPLERTSGSRCSPSAAQRDRSPHWRRGAAGMGRWHRQWGCEIDQTNRTRVELMTGCIAATAPKVRAAATPVDSNRR